MRFGAFAEHAPRLSWRYFAVMASVLALAGVIILPGRASAATGSASLVVTELSAGPGYVTAGTEVAGTMQIVARGNMTVEAVGIAVRNAAGTAYDFPGAQPNVTLGTTPYTFTSGQRTFTAGTYTVFGFWEDYSGTYHDLPSYTMTVGASVSGAAATELSTGPGYVSAGTEAEGTMQIVAAQTTTATVGIAVRDAAGTAYDFPGAQPDVTLGTTPYAFTSGQRTFTAGTYTTFGFWEDTSGTYHNLPSYTMTVGASGPGSGPLGISGNWNLVLDSEFNGSSLDTSVWQTGWFANSGVTNHANGAETDCYNPANVTFPGDGTVHLQVTAVPSSCPDGSYSYTGAMITTNPDDSRPSGGFQYTYGVAEALVYIPPSASSTIANWPAFWGDGQDWPADGEDDIMEGLGGSACFHFQYLSSGSHEVTGACATGNFSGWHTFASDWEPGSVTYYYDGTEVGQITTGVTSSPMYLILDNTTGSPGGPTVTPADFQVSYVKVWQQS